MAIFDQTEGQVPNARRAAFTLAFFLILLSCVLPVTPGQLALAAFMPTVLVVAWIYSRGAIEGIEAERDHRPRVFEEDPVEVRLRLRQTRGLSQTLVVVEDQFFASMSPRQRRLAPIMSPRWEAQFHYIKSAERHRGVYFLGPLTIHAADPLGVFMRARQVDCVTPLTIYPRPIPLPGYRFLGARPPMGPSMDAAPRVGQGEEIIGIRPYRAGDPPSRIHWRSSMRLRELHVMELDTSVQTDVVVFLDLARASRYGTGRETTTEIAIGCAVSILSEAGAARRRLGLLEAREKSRWYPPAAGLAHAHMMLDRLAVTAPEGDLDFWAEAAPHAAELRCGARAVFIVVARRADPMSAIPLLRGLEARGVAADIVLIDESRMTRIWRDQTPTAGTSELDFERLRMALGFAGARVFPLRREDTVQKLLPRCTMP